MHLIMADSRGVEPHPISQNLVFKASRRTNPAALLSISGKGDWTRTNTKNFGDSRAAFTLHPHLVPAERFDRP